VETGVFFCTIFATKQQEPKRLAEKTVGQ